MTTTTTSEASASTTTTGAPRRGGPVGDAVASVPFNAHLGLEVSEAAEGRATVLLGDAAPLRNHIGGPHAAAMYAAAEAASGAAVLSAFGDLLSQVVPLLAGASIEYRKVAMGAVRASAELETTREDVLAALADDPGGAPTKGAEVPVRVTIEDASGRVVAQMSARWFLRRIG